MTEMSSGQPTNNPFDKADGTYQTMHEHQALRPSLAVTTAEGNAFGIAEIGAPSLRAARRGCATWPAGRAATPRFS